VWIWQYHSCDIFSPTSHSAVWSIFSSWLSNRWCSPASRWVMFWCYNLNHPYNRMSQGSLTAVFGNNSRVVAKRLLEVNSETGATADRQMNVTGRLRRTWKHNKVTKCVMTGSYNRKCVGVLLTGMCVSCLHALVEAELPFPRFQLSLSVWLLPLSRLLPRDLGNQLCNAMLRLLHQGGQVSSSAFKTKN